MRIGMICPYSLTVPGGVQTQVLGLARAVRRKGHSVRVLAPCDGPPPDAGVTPLGLSLPTASNGSVAPVAPDIPAQLRTIRAMRDEAFDIVHLHEPLAPGPTTTCLLTKPAPMIGTFHMAGRSLPYELMPRVVKYLANRLDDRVAVSEDARAMAKKYLGHEYALLFNAVEVRRYDDSPTHAADAPTILFVGRHEERKGLRVLLDAASSLPADVRIWIAGEGPQTADLQAEFAGDPRLEWLGAISEGEKIARLKGADVFCAPSLHGESFGVVLLEGMAAGTPVVASDIPGYANAARQGSDAALFSPGDPAALAAAIRQVLDDPDRARDLVVSGRERATEFSMARLADLYIGRYETILARG